MGHKITIKPDSKHDREKFLTACTCGVEGRFVTLSDAKSYAQIHVQHYNLDPACITVVEAESPKPEAAKAAAPPPYVKAAS